MAGKQLLTRLKEGIKKSHLASNMAFSFILIALEKLAELEFQCPCTPTWNGVFSSAFFIVPPVIAFALMLIIQERRCDTWCWKCVFSCVPAIVWLILIFLDGEYLVCAVTYWEGTFVSLDAAPPKKWCKPTQKGNVTSEKLMLRSRNTFVISQVVGAFLLFVLCLYVIVYAIRPCMSKGEEDKKDEGMDMEERKKLNAKELEMKCRGDIALTITTS